MKGLLLWAVAAACGSWVQPEPGDAGEGGSSPDNDGTGRYYQTVRVRQPRRAGVRVQKPVVEPLKSRTGSNLVDAGRIAMHARSRATPKPFNRDGGEAIGKACGVPMAMLQGKSWAPHPSNRQQ